MLWLHDHISTLVLGAALLVAVALAVYTMIRDKKNGVSGCSGSCSTCSGCPMKNRCDPVSGD
ncbi:MAG: FeoB-associated Cys-rich membrane protein [Clostridia bacterium]|nr:FeoB-associated Cys-rich membrane protein [Clostridia bacterium]